MPYIFRKLGKMSQNLSSAVVVIGALRVNVKERQKCDYSFYPMVRDWGAQWLSGRVLDQRPRGRWFKPHLRHCVVSLSKNINPSLVLVQPRKTRAFITVRLLMGRKESNQTNKQ